MIGSCQRLLIGRVCPTILGIILVFFGGIADAQQLPRIHFGETELADLDPQVSSQILEIKRNRGPKDERVKKISELMAGEELPAEVRKKLTLLAAGWEVDRRKKAQLYISILDDSDPQKDADIRWLAIHPFQSFGQFQPNEDRIAEMEAIAAPLLAIPLEEYTPQTIRTLSLYADYVRDIGMRLASTQAQLDFRDAKIKEATEKRRVSEQSVSLLNKLFQLVEERIEERNATTGPPPTGPGEPEDRLANSRAGILHKLERSKKIIEIMTKEVEEQEKFKREILAPE